MLFIFNPIVILFYNILCTIHMTWYMVYLEKYVVIWSDKKKKIGTSCPLRIQVNILYFSLNICT